MRYLSNLNLERNQLQNAALHPSATAPSNPVLGQVYFSTLNNENTLYIWNGTVWEPVGQLTSEEVVALINLSTTTINYDQIAVIPLGTHTSGDYVATVSAGSGLIANGIGESAAVTIAHADTSSQASVDNSDGTVIQDIGLDGFGHITSVGSYNLDNRYFTETESDNRFAAKVHTHTASDIIDFDTEVSNNTDVAANTADRHTQNTDLGTSNNSFYIGTTGPVLHNTSGVLEVKDTSGSTFADLTVNNAEVKGNLNVLGTITAIKSTEVDIGDSKILLNANITEQQYNADGGIALKRIFDNSGSPLRHDAELYYNEAADRWHAIFGEVSSAPVDRQIANKYKVAFGNGADTSYVITHSLNTQDAVVSIRRTASPYDVVYADVEMTSLSTVTIRTATAPSTDEYTVTVIG